MKSRSNYRWTVAAVLAVAVCPSVLANAQAEQRNEPPAKVTMDQDGTVRMPAYAVPPSIYASDEGNARSISILMKFRETPASAEIDMLDRVKAVYPVSVHEVEIAGVRTDVVVPTGGVARQNRDRVLINLHGGAFHCQRTLQLVESIPIASTAKIKVISVDYRCAPEYKFPAASEDVAAVYKELLKRYKARNIGIYGCSAGGTLTAESVAWFQKEKLPRPGAIGIFCGADGILGGDSHYIAPLPGLEVPPPTPNPPQSSEREYFRGVDVNEALISPTRHPEVLGQFPPTLLITATRDMDFSSVVYAHSQLTKAGVDAELHVWEGMIHCFFFFPDIPESTDAYETIASFFGSHLGKRTVPRR
jgi:monoterpene epsilon-lactone hydrolase